MVVKNPLNIFVPEYLNEDFFKNALEEGLREAKVTVHGISFEWGSVPGENYCSSIYRVFVTFERWTSNSDKPNAEENVSLILKTIPITEQTQFLEDAGVFIKEKLMYTDILPRLEILGSGEKLGPSIYYSVKEPVQTIVFNDLKVDGFEVASRVNGLDFNHSKLMLEKLGEFHGTSMVLLKKDPKYLNRFNFGMLCPEAIEKTPMFKELMGGSLAQVIKIASTWPGYEKITQNLQRYLDNFVEYTKNLGLPRDDDKLRTINHGDLWTNNFMYAYDDANHLQKPTKVIFIDFQMSFYSSPACDINFFLNSSPTLEVLQTKRDDLIEVYYNSLRKTLENLRYEPIPTLDDLKHDLRKRELYGLFSLYGFFPMISMPKELSKDNSLTDENDIRAKRIFAVVSSEKGQNFLKFNLKRMADLGVFEDY